MKSTRDTTSRPTTSLPCLFTNGQKVRRRCDIDDIVDRGPVDHGFVVVNKSMIHDVTRWSEVGKARRTSSSPSPPLPVLLPPFIPPTHDADASWRGGGKARAWKKPSPIRHGVVCARDCVLRVG